MPGSRKNPQKSELFLEARRQSASMRENNDCAVIALAVVTGLPYETCHNALEAAGRSRREGVYQRQWVAALRLLGFETVTIRDFSRLMIANYPKAHRSLTWLTTNHPRRFAKYWADLPPCILSQASHVSAFRDGRVHDWNDDRACRIEQVIFVCPIGQREEIIRRVEKVLFGR